VHCDHAAFLDVAWPATLNEYSYCINSPEIYVDLDGEFFTLITAAIGAVAGAIIGGAASAITQISCGKSFDEP